MPAKPSSGSAGFDAAAVPRSHVWASSMTLTTTREPPRDIGNTATRSMNAGNAAFCPAWISLIGLTSTAGVTRNGKYSSASSSVSTPSDFNAPARRLFVMIDDIAVCKVTFTASPSAHTCMHTYLYTRPCARHQHIRTKVIASNPRRRCDRGRVGMPSTPSSRTRMPRQRPWACRDTSLAPACASIHPASTKSRPPSSATNSRVAEDGRYSPIKGNLNLRHRRPNQKVAEDGRYTPLKRTPNLPLRRSTDHSPKTEDTAP